MKMLRTITSAMCLITCLNASALTFEEEAALIACKVNNNFYNENLKKCQKIVQKKDQRENFLSLVQKELLKEVPGLTGRELNSLSCINHRRSNDEFNYECTLKLDKIDECSLEFDGNEQYQNREIRFYINEDGKLKPDSSFQSWSTCLG